MSQSRELMLIILTLYTMSVAHMLYKRKKMHYLTIKPAKKKKTTVELKSDQHFLSLSENPQVSIGWFPTH